MSDSKDPFEQPCKRHPEGKHFVQPRQSVIYTDGAAFYRIVECRRCNVRRVGPRLTVIRTLDNTPT